MNGSQTITDINGAVFGGTDNTPRCDLVRRLFEREEQDEDVHVTMPARHRSRPTCN
jgi:hypothetical protein